jgi:hypothetical protein
MENLIGVIQYGLGPIGQSIVRDITQKAGFRILGAIDVDEQKVGKDLGELVGFETPFGVKVSSNSKEVLSNEEAQLVILSTVSSLIDCYPQIEETIQSHKSLISTCEELVYSWLTHPDLSRRIDELAKKNGVAILGTGVNPGFIMDYVPLVVSGICKNVNRIKIFRIQDASLRRLSFQTKIGAGLKIAEFEKRQHKKQIRHVGLTESIHMIAGGLGWELDKTTDETFPILAESTVESSFIKVPAGNVKGMRQIGKGFRNGEEIITLEMVMALGQDNPRDVIEIEGTPNVRLFFEGGVHGDIATTAIVVNSIPQLLKLSPGLKTMRDMPPPVL